MGSLRSLLGPLCAVLGRSWGLCWRSGGGLGTYVGDLGPLLGLYGRSWAALGASIGGLGCTWAALGAYVGDLGPLLGLYSRSWSALGAAVCGPVPLLEPILAVLAALGLATGRQPGANPQLATGRTGRGGQPGANRALDNRAPCVSIRGEGQPGGRNGFRQPGA